ncbi:MAG: DegT/DnrJ/EryC1/StrS family aminotransferase [bacterium]|nr:DegT/DnrJ/EryC1/StrS family aminotransferase [bacterium]
MKIPPLDLQAQYAEISVDVMRRVQEVFTTQRFILGPIVEELEAKIASLCRVKHGIGVASGSDALLLSLMALDLKPGDIVVTTPLSFFSTVSAITRLGARPHFVDVDPVTCNLDPDLLAQAPVAGVKAVLPVHLFGQLVCAEEIISWADSVGAAVVEDACQAIGATRQNRPAGNWGKLTGFSFYPTKNLGGAGDGGMIVTDDDELNAHLRSLRDHGAKKRYFHDEVGVNSRLGALQAAVLLAKLPHLEAWNLKRREIADRYRNRLAGLPITLPVELPGNYHIYHQFVLRSNRRDELKAYLTQEGIFTEIYYPVPLHLQDCFAFLGYQTGDFPQAERAAKEVLALPIFPELGEERFEYVCEKVRGFFG